MEFKAGDLVSCKDPNYFSQLSLKKNVGIVLEIKKNACKVMFDDFQGGYFLPEEHLQPLDVSLRAPSSVSLRGPEGREAISSLFQQVQELVHLLQAESFDLEKTKGGVRLQIYVDKLSLDQLDQLRARLGSRLQRLEILPHMMAELLVELEITV